MAIKRCRASINVVEAAKIRIKNIFRNGLPVYLSFSGGKDSLCLAQLVMNLIQAGEINPAQLTVQFIDEEAIFPCMEEKVREWRKKFMLVGVKFEWFCLEVKQYNCFNELSNDETFICWDRYKSDIWVRRPPSFGIREHPLLRPRIDAYQDFLPRMCAGGITITGIRTAESIQRLKNVALMLKTGRTISNKHQTFPLYDWTDNDVWLYLLREKVDIPEIYLFLWQSGTQKGRLRVSQFLSIDTARNLVKMNEYYPDLMERIVRREPNAYLASLYWDSEMFGRNTLERKKNEQGTSEKDYKAALVKLFSDIDGNFNTSHKRYVAGRYRNLFMSVSTIMDDKDCKAIYEGLISGDPKMRTYRALYQRIYGKYIIDAQKRRRCRMDDRIMSPLSTLRWVGREIVRPNDYNPNKVSKQNLELLKQSILANGWTLPIVVRPDMTIIDGFHRWTVAGEEPLKSMLDGKVPVVIVEHKDKSGNIYGTVTHNRARGTHLLEPMKAIVKELMGEGKTVEEIGKQLGMRPEEIFRLSDFSKEDFLRMMIKPNQDFSKAEFITKI